MSEEGGHYKPESLIPVREQRKPDSEQNIYIPLFNHLPEERALHSPKPAAETLTLEFKNVSHIGVILVLYTSHTVSCH